MSKVTVELKLSPEDIDAITARVAEQIEAAKGGGKAGAGAKGGKAGTGAKGGKAEDDDDFENVDGDDGDGDDFGEDAADDEPIFGRKDVTVALREYSAKTSKAEALKLLKKVGGVGGLSELAEDKFGAVIKAAKAATAKAGK